MSNLVDSRGQDIKTTKIPAVHWKGYSLPIRVLSEEDTVKEKGSVSPADVIKEMRAMYIELQDRFTLLATGLAAQAKENPGGEVDQYLSEIGLTLTDMQGKKMYEPNPEIIKGS